LLAVVVVISFSYSSSITVMNPHSGDVWYKGLTYTIKWTKSADLTTPVKIRLYKGNQRILAIKNSTSSNSYTWKIPKSIPAGTYYIRVKTIDNQVFDNGETFEIRDFGIFKTKSPLSKDKGIAMPNKLKGSKIVIPVVSPSGNERWYEGKVYNIIWKRNGLKETKFNIYLEVLPWRTIVKTIAKNYSVIANTGVYEWHIPHNIFKQAGEYANYYRILVKSADGSSYGYSKPFLINQKLSKNIYKISPKIYYDYRKKATKSQGDTAVYADLFQGNPPLKGECKIGYSYYYIPPSPPSSLTSLKGSPAYYTGDINRTKLYFDVNFLKGKFITNAFLRMSHKGGQKCGTKFYEIVNQSGKSIFDNIEIEEIAASGPALLRLVMTWANHSTKNKGILITGTDESFAKANRHCIEWCNGIYLEIHTMEKSK
jgi:hypothetical protein